MRGLYPSLSSDYKESQRATQMETSTWNPALAKIYVHTWVLRNVVCKAQYLQVRGIQQ